MFIPNNCGGGDMIPWSQLELGMFFRWWMVQPSNRKRFELQTLIMQTDGPFPIQNSFWKVSPVITTTKMTVSSVLHGKPHHWNLKISHRLKRNIIFQTSSFRGKSEAPENWWLESMKFLAGLGLLFQGEMVVLGRVFVRVLFADSTWRG